MNTTKSNPLKQSVIATTLLAGAAFIPGLVNAADSTWLVVTHKVKDYPHWKTGFDAAEVMKREYGWKQSTVYSINGDPNNVVVMEEFDTLEGAKTFASLPELKEAMVEAGVQGIPTIEFYTVAGH